jgi:phosphoglycerate kinase
MRFGINTLDDFEFRGKTVLCRLDLNSPFDQTKKRLRDITRIKNCLPTIRELRDKSAKLVLLTHQGGDLEYQNFVSTKYHAEVISELLGYPVKFIDDVCGPAARKAIKNLKEGEILLLENVRYMAEEMTFFETKMRLSPAEQANTIVVKKLAPLGDVYVCEAFSAAHRSQPTLVGFPELLPSAMGRLFEKELEALTKIVENPEHPCIFLLGGAKVDDAFLIIDKVLQEGVADLVLTGGLVGNIMLLAKGVVLGEPSTNVIKKLNFEYLIDIAKQIQNKYTGKIMTPEDLAYAKNGERVEISTDSLPVERQLVDIGQNTIQIYQKEICKAKTIFINGPVGMYEMDSAELGTKTLWEKIASTSAFTLIGGGDSIAAASKYGLNGKFSFVSTGGGAMIRFVAGEELPVIKALKKSSLNFWHGN